MPKTTEGEVGVQGDGGGHRERIAGDGTHKNACKAGGETCGRGDGGHGHSGGRQDRKVDEDEVAIVRKVVQPARTSVRQFEPDSAS